MKYTSVALAVIQHLQSELLGLSFENAFRSIALDGNIADLEAPDFEIRVIHNHFLMPILYP